MGHIKEPVGVDLIVVPMTLSAEDRTALSSIIAQYKRTKEVPTSKPKLAKTSTRKRVPKLLTKGREPANKKSAVITSK